MNEKKAIFCVLMLCISINVYSQQTMTIDEAVQFIATELGQRLRNVNLADIYITPGQSLEVTANELRQQLVRNINIAVLNFASNSQRLSTYVMDELINAIVREGSLTVVNRQQLDFIRREQNFQLSGEVSDESAQHIGRLLGAQLVLTGSFTEIGNTYRFRVQVITVETGVVQYSNSITIRRNDPVISGIIREEDDRRREEENRRRAEQAEREARRREEERERRLAESRARREELEINPVFNLGLGFCAGGEYVDFDIELLCFQVGVNVGRFEFLLEAIGGPSFIIETDEGGFAYHLGGLIEYRFFDLLALGLGGGLGGHAGFRGAESFSHPYIRGSLSFVLGIGKLGAFYDYSFDYGSKIGIRAFIEIGREIWH